MNEEHSALPEITRFPSPVKKSPFSTKEEKIAYIAERFGQIMEALGLDLDDPSLTRTPLRVAKMYVNEVFSGLDPETFPEVRYIDNAFSYPNGSNVVLVKAHFTSFCEHHFVPMTGFACVAYIPKKKVIGLSKISRIVRYFAKRPQVQERLSAQIADSLALLLETEDVAVSTSATHFCVMARGIEDQHAHTIANVLRGEFLSNESVKREFFEGINRIHQV